MTGASETKPPTDIPHYRAFISYRHAEVDSAVAKAVQHGLERFWVPKSARGASGSARIAPVFRDKEELPVSSRLGDDIEAALRGADTLVVICSPRTQESNWVAREIETFLRWHDQDRVFVVLAEGEPYDVIPERLLFETRTITDPDGSTREERVEIEPLACDFRSAARRERRTELTRLAAAILDVSFDSLVRRTQRRRMRLMAAAMAITTTVAIYALWSAARIREQYRQTQINESEALAVEAQELLARGDRMEAIQVALAALPKSSTSNDRPLVPAAQRALEQALEVYPTRDVWRACYSIDGVGNRYEHSAQGLQAMLSKHDVLVVSRMETGEEVSRIPLFEEYPKDSIFNDVDFGFCGENIYGYSCISGTGYLIVYDSTDGTELWNTTIEESYSRDCIVCSNDGTKIAVCNSVESSGKDGGRDLSACAVTVFDSRDGTALFSGTTREQEVPKEIDGQPFWDTSSHVHASFSPDDSKLAVADMALVTLFDLDTGDRNQAAMNAYYNHDILLLDDRIICTSAKDAFLLSGSPNTEVIVSAFDLSLNCLWSCSEHPVWPFDSNGDYASTSSGTSSVVGAFQSAKSSSDGPFDSDIIFAGCDVIVYEHQTGKVINRFAMSSSIEDCLCNSSGVLFIVDSNGTICLRLIDADQMSQDLMYYYDCNVQQTTNAVLAHSGETNGSYLIVYRKQMNKFNLFRFEGDGTDVPSAHKVESIDGFEDFHFQEALPTVGFNESTVAAFDPGSLEQLWSINIGSLTSFKRKPSVYTTETSVYLCAKESAYPATYRVARFTLNTGEQLDSFVLYPMSNADYSINKLYETEAEGKQRLVTVSTHEVKVYDFETHELIFTIPEAQGDKDEPEEVWYNESSLISDNHLILLQEMSNSTHLRRCKIYSLTDGHDAMTILDDFPLSETASIKMSCIVNKDGSLISLLGSDDKLRLLDLHTGSFVWESGDIPATTARLISFAPETDDIILQDLSGRISLISRSDGRVLHTSSEEFEPIIWGSYGTGYVDDKTIVVLYERSGDPFASRLLKNRGAGLIVTTEDTFGMTSVIPMGMYVTSSGDFIVRESGKSSSYTLFHHHSLDELIDLAHKAIEGHELTDAERRLYRIAP